MLLVVALSLLFRRYWCWCWFCNRRADDDDIILLLNNTSSTNTLCNTGKYISSADDTLCPLLFLFLLFPLFAFIHSNTNTYLLLFFLVYGKIISFVHSNVSGTFCNYSSLFKDSYTLDCNQNISYIYISVRFFSFGFRFYGTMPFICYCNQRYC